MHLTNKKAIGKQTPYCVVSFNGEKQRTRAINRAGQRAHWDQELRFTLYESEGSSSTPQSLDTPPELPPKQEDGPPKIKGGFKMQVACFAEGLKEPDLIGQTTVDLTRVLTKGEHDGVSAMWRVHRVGLTGEAQTGSICHTRIGSRGRCRCR